MPAAPRLALLAEAVSFGQVQAGIRAIDLISETSWTVPFSGPTGGTEVVKMDEPGPTYRAGQFLFDVSPLDGPPDVHAWSSTSLQPVASVPCVGPGGYYWSAAEPAPGVCLVIRGAGETLRNGVTVFPANVAMGLGATFRMAAGGRWTVPVTRRAYDFVAIDTTPDQP